MSPVHCQAINQAKGDLGFIEHIASIFNETQYFFQENEFENVWKIGEAICRQGIKLFRSYKHRGGGVIIRCENPIDHSKCPFWLAPFYDASIYVCIYFNLINAIIQKWAFLFNWSKWDISMKITTHYLSKRSDIWRCAWRAWLRDWRSPRCGCHAGDRITSSSALGCGHRRGRRMDTREPYMGALGTGYWVSSFRVALDGRKQILHILIWKHISMSVTLGYPVSNNAINMYGLHIYRAWKCLLVHILSLRYSYACVTVNYFSFKCTQRHSFKYFAWYQ